MASNKEQIYNDNAANYFILFVLAIIAVPSTFVFLKNRLSSAKESSSRCSCRDCKQKEASSSAKESRYPSVGTVFKAIVIIILWALFVSILVNSTGTEQPSAGYFDPYAILGLEPGATMEAIKKQHKTLSLINHPDKGGDEEKYMRIVKAYETLTDDAIRENWEKFGNPDGPQAMSVGIALPSWLVKKDNTFIVLGVYMALLVIGLPAVVGCWWRSWKKFDTSSKVMNSTMGLYYHALDPTARVKAIIEVLSASEEFQRIPMRESDEKLEKITKRIPDNHQLKKKPKFTAPYAVKSHLLLYVQLCRQQYELKTGHKADLTFVLSKVRSLIGGVITISTAKGFFTPIVESLQLLQFLTQSSWKETPLLQLPHFNEYSVSNAGARKFNVHDVLGFAALPQEKKKEFYDKEEFKTEQIQDIEDVLEFLPTKVALEYTIAVEGEDPDTIVCGAIVTYHFVITRNPTDAALANTVVLKKRPIEPDNPTAIKRKAALDALRPKRIVHAPHFWGDQREECWWVVIGDLRTSGTTGGLVGIQKVGTLEGDTPAEGKIKFMAPPNEGNYTFVAHLICDGYIGFDKKTEFKIKVVKDVAAEQQQLLMKQKQEKKKSLKIKEIKEGQEDVEDDEDDEDSFSDEYDDDDDDDDEEN